MANSKEASVKRSRQLKFALLSPLVCAALLASGLAFADSKSSVIEAFSRVSEIRNVVISPSGQRVAYQRMENDNNLILVLDVASGELVFSMGVDDSDINSIRFVGDTTVMIVFDQRYHRADFGLSYRRRIRFLDLETGDIDNFGGWTPDGWDMNRSSTRGTVVGITEDFANLFVTMWEGNANLYSLFEYSIDHGARNVALARGTSDTIDWFVDDTGTPVARVDFDEEEDLFTVYAYRNSEPEVLFQEQTENPQMRVRALTPEQDGLIYMTRLPGADELTLHTLSLADGSRSAPIFSFSLGGALVDSGRRGVAFWKAGTLVDEYEFPDTGVERFFRAIQASMPGEPIELVNFTDDFDHVVVRLTRKWGQAFYLLFSKGAQEPVLIAKEETGAPNDDVRFDHNYGFVASDGRVVRARLTYNGDFNEQKRKPLVVLSQAPTWLEQYFAAQGYVVIRPRLRDVHVRGTFIPQGATQSAGRMHSDINDAVRHLVDKGIADPARVCVIGFRRGAYLAALAASESPDTYRCIASVNGFLDLERPARRTREGVKEDSYRVRLFEAQFAVDASNKDSLHERSPINHVGDDFPTTLLVYFKKSDKLLESDAKAFSRTLKTRNREHDIKAINTDDLTFEESKTRRQVLKALSDFVEEQL